MTSRQKLYCFIGLVAGSALLYSVFVLGFLSDRINQNAQELKSVQIDFARNETLFGALESFQKTAKEEEANLRRLDALFINKDIPLDFSLFLKALAESNNLESTFSSGGSGASKKEAWDFLTYQVTLNGSFQDVMRFIAKIEKAPYLIEIQNFQISNGAPSRDNVNAIVSLKIFAK